MNRGSALSFLILASLTVSIPRSLAMPRPGSNTDPKPGPAGKPPYEMAGRAEAHPPVAHFADCTAWTVETEDAEANLYRTQEQRLFREYCGKLVYRATGRRPTITVRPTQPIPIPEPWDCLNAWNWGNVWSWARRKDTPPLHVEALVLDATGKEHAIGLGTMAYQYWFPMHRKVTGAIARPARFAGIRFRNGTNTELRTIYLGPVSFYKEELKPLTFDPWPEKLPFPIRPETILPTNKTATFTNSTRPNGPATVFEYKGEDTTLAYRLDPAEPFLDGLEVVWNGRRRRPCQGAKVTLGNGKEATVRTTQSRLKGNVLQLEWSCVAGDLKTILTGQLRIAQKSLILDLVETGPGNIAKVTLGRAEGLRQPRTFWVPYLTYGNKNSDPRILLDEGLFLFSQFDWYVSDGSALFGVAGRMGKDWAEFNGGVTYNPKTDGTRNPLRERLFLTASPDVQEVLPNIPNPPSPMRDAQADRLWRVRSGAGHEAEIKDAQRLRSLGLEKVTVRYHEDSWRDAGESFTFRTDAAPGRGGDAALKHMVSSVQALDWRVGLYTNYTDFAPVNAHWNEDWVSRTTDGNWGSAWTRCYAPKPMISVQMQALLAPQIQAKFGENHSYCDVHTAVTPFQRVDYDARVPGAGTFRRTFECFGRLLYNEKFAHKGPVYSEGRNHWWYAGLTDGNYAQLTAPDPPREPLFVDFDLLKMHPLQMDAGMGSPGMFYRGSALRNYRQFIATTLAYGHIGFLGAGEADMMRIYYLLQPLQEHYVMRKVEHISYGDGETTSQALASGAIDSGRVRVRYEGGMTVIVNGSGETWHPRGSVPLPPWGFRALADDLRAHSTHALLPAFLPDGFASHLPPPIPKGIPLRTADHSSGPNSHYLASPDGFLSTRGMATDGAGVLKREGDNWELVPAREFNVFGFAPDLVNCRDLPFTVRAMAEDGTMGDTVPVRWSRGLCYVLRGKDAPFKYRIVPGKGKARPQVPASCSRLAVLGQDVWVYYRRKGQVESARWHVPGRRPQAVEATQDNRRWLVPVPKDFPSDSLLWLELQRGGETHWLDMLSQEPLALEAMVERRDYRPGEPVEVKLTLDNWLEMPMSVLLGAVPDTGKVERAKQTVALPVQATPSRAQLWGSDGLSTQALEINMRWELPWQTGKAKLDVFAKYNDVIVRTSLQIQADITPRGFRDLLAADVAWAKGSCSRGGKEIAGLSGVHDGSVSVNTASCGGVKRKALFMHPPYGKRVAGYVFAEIPVELPKEPVRLHAFTGMRDGMDASDGVVFSVQVTPDGKPTQTVFERHHTKLAWEKADVDLSAFAGRRVTLRLTVDCGPADNTTADHAQWGELGLVFQQDVLRVR